MFLRQAMSPISDSASLVFCSMCWVLWGQMCFALRSPLDLLAKVFLSLEFPL